MSDKKRRKGEMKRPKERKRILLIEKLREKEVKAERREGEGSGRECREVTKKEELGRRKTNERADPVLEQVITASYYQETRLEGDE